MGYTKRPAGAQSLRGPLRHYSSAQSMNLPRTRLLTAALLGLSTLSAFAANWWEEMDYGRFLSATYLNADGKSTLDGDKVSTCV